MLNSSHVDSRNRPVIARITFLEPLGSSVISTGWRGHQSGRSRDSSSSIVKVIYSTNPFRISLLVRSSLPCGWRGIVELLEAGNVEDHIYCVRFHGPECAKQEQHPGQGVRMYFKLSELEKVDRDVDTEPVK